MDEQRRKVVAALMTRLGTMLAGDKELLGKAAIAFTKQSTQQLQDYDCMPDDVLRAAVEELVQPPAAPAAAAAAAAGVPSARTEGTAPTAAAAGADAGAPLLPDNAADFVSRIVLDRQTIGTIVPLVLRLLLEAPALHPSIVWLLLLLPAPVLFLRMHLLPFPCGGASPAHTTGAGAAGILDRLTETLREGLAEVKQDLGCSLAGVKQDLVEVKSLQLRAASTTRHASSITSDDLTMVEGVLGIRWVLQGEQNTSGADGPPDEPGFEWDTTEHEARQKKGYMGRLEELVRPPSYMLWSEQVDRNDLLRTCPGTGGATELPFTIGCRVDALITLAHAPFSPDAKIAATVEMKKLVVQQSVRQAKATFICASLHSHIPVVSILTDMGHNNMAFYCTGSQPGTGHRLCVQHAFKDCDELGLFLHKALSSVPQDALLFRGGNMTAVLELQDPPRKLLLQDREPSQQSWKAAMAVLATHAAGGSDVARLDDLAAFGDQGLDEVTGHVPYIA